MPRTIEVSASRERIDAVLKRIQDIDGIVGLSRQVGASLKPRGDVLSIQATNDASRPVLEVLDELRIQDEGSVNTTSPLSVLTREHQNELDRESNETVWDEMAFMLRGDANTSFNYLASMTLAGAAAAGGLWTDTLHLIVGAMLIAPAFEPLARLPFGLITGSREMVTRGLVSVSAGYLMLCLGAALSTVFLLCWSSGPSRIVAEQEWATYWSTLTLPGLFVSALGGLAGAIVIGGLRSVLTTGVMVTLALIPSAALVGMGIVVGDFSLARDGFIRWFADVALVLVMTGIVFALKKRFMHRRGRTIS